MRKPVALVTTLALLTPLTQLPLPVAAASEDLASRFTLGVMPDTQYYARFGTQETGDIFGTQFGSNPFDVQTQFLADNQDALGLEFVTHLGDVVDQAQVLESWDIASRAMSTLDDANVNYSILPGNHDYGMLNGKSALETYFPETRAAKSPTFKGRYQSVGFYPDGGDSYAFYDQAIDSEYHIFEAEGQEYLVLALGFRANDDTIAWAQDVINQHPTLPVILTSHEITRPNEDGSTEYSKQYGQHLWDTLIRKNDQIFLTMSGHYHGAGYHISTNDAGHQVVNILQDYQSDLLGGNGSMGQLQFDLSNNTLEMTAFSPWVANKKPESLTRFDQLFPSNLQDEYVIDLDFDARFADFNEAWEKGDENDPNYAEILKDTVSEGFVPYTSDGVKAKDSEDYPKVAGTAVHWRPGRTQFEGAQLNDGDAVPAGSVIPDIQSGADMTRVDYRAGTNAESVTYSKDVHPLSADTGSLRWTQPTGKEAVSWFETATGADINSMNFPDGYTLEAFVKLGEDFTRENNGAGALTRDASGSEVNPSKPDSNPAQVLSTSGGREVRWRAVGENLELHTNQSHLLEKGDWAHIAVVNDPKDKSVKMYVDGAPIMRNGTGPIGIAGEDVKWLLGATAVDGVKQNGWVGSIGEIRIVDHPLAEGEWLTARADKSAPTKPTEPTKPAPVVTRIISAIVATLGGALAGLVANLRNFFGF